MILNEGNIIYTKEEEINNIAEALSQFSSTENYSVIHREKIQFWSKPNSIPQY